MLIEKFILPFKENGKIFRTIKELCFIQQPVTSNLSEGRMVASPEAATHKELRSSFRENPPNAGPGYFPAE